MLAIPHNQQIKNQYLIFVILANQVSLSFTELGDVHKVARFRPILPAHPVHEEHNPPPFIDSQVSSQSEKQGSIPHRQIGALRSSPQRAQNRGRLSGCATSSSFFSSPNDMLRSTYAAGTRQAGSSLSLAEKAALLLPTNANRGIFIIQYA